MKESCKAVDGFVSYDSFMRATFWFDQTEASKQRANSHFFDRVKMIKEILFKTHCRLVPDKVDPMVELSSFCEVLQAPRVQHAKAQFADYGEYLFAPVR